MISRHTFETARAKAAEFKALLATGDRDDLETLVRLTVLGGWLSGCVTVLLDEIERLEGDAHAQAPPVRFDPRGGSA